VNSAEQISRAPHEFAGDGVPIGLFETDTEGWIVRFIPEGRDLSIFAGQHFVGRNLATEVSKLFSSEQFSSKYEQFCNSWNSADNFLMIHETGSLKISVRILLGKVPDRLRPGRVSKILVAVNFD
jgi:hypothetical protein